jgi:hypothetical protein
MQGQPGACNQLTPLAQCSVLDVFTEILLTCSTSSRREGCTSGKDMEHTTTHGTAPPGRHAWRTGHMYHRFSHTFLCRKARKPDVFLPASTCYLPTHTPTECTHINFFPLASMATLEPVLSERGIAPLPLEVFVREDVTRSVNLRDIGHLSHRIKQKVIFRSSQVVSPVQIRALDIKSVIDLRRAPATCTFQHRNILQKIHRFGSLVAAWFGPRRLPPRSGNGNKHEQSLNKDNDINQPTKRERLLQAGDVLPGEAAPCWRCTEACLGKYGCQALVYHVDLLPGLVPVYIFAKLPWTLKLKVTWMAIRGGKKGRAHVEPVVAGAVADPNVLGYLELYKASF